MFDQGGELYGGSIGRFGRMYAVWSMMLSMVLVLSSGATVITAYLHESSEVTRNSTSFLKIKKT